MRTSRIAHETERIVNVLSPITRASRRRSLRSYTHTPEAASSHQTANTSNGNNTSSKSSTPVSSSHDSAYQTQSTSTSLGKRKRGDTTTISAEGTTTRRSPRKASKQDAEETETKRKPRRQPAKHIKGPSGHVAIEPPPNWEKVYTATAGMRKRVLAPVDTMGCESLAEEHRNPRDKRLQTLIALMLSSQTKDPVTAAAMKNLQDNLPGGFCLESLLEVEPHELNRLIGKVGFHNNKTKFIKSVALILRDRFNGDIPDTIEGLVSLPGVGPKMAYLCMSSAWGRDEGIGVDVHVHRITNLWGWHKTSTPEQTRAELEAWLPRDKWHDINHLLVGFGQTICLPVGRKCGECDLATEKLCPSAVASSPVKRKVKKEVELTAEKGVIVETENVIAEVDDAAIKIEVDSKEDGQFEVQAVAGAVT